MGRLEGRVAVVTGGSLGLGRGIVRRLGREGAQVVFCSRNAESGLRTQRELEALGIDSRYVQADIAHLEQAQYVVRTAVKDFGRVDILINNAQAMLAPSLIVDKTDAAFHASLASGLFGTLWMMRAAFPAMRAQGSGRIVNFGSVSATIGMRHQGEYASTKGAIGALTRTAAQEWGRFNILVNMINPVGRSHANEAKPAAAGAEAQDITDTVQNAGIPLGRMGDPETDIGNAVLGLVSERCRYITGTTINVDGGAHLSPMRLDYDALMGGIASS
jgi:NAD(P)-dependent dehydrogenase (short-subunit alcohol dehydrogenase family)